MGEMESWEEELFQRVLESRLLLLEERRRKDPDFSVEDVEKVLSDSYRRQGLGWAGKSPVQEITEAATVAAYEIFLSRWKEEEGSRIPR